MTKPGPGTKFSITYKGRVYDSGKRWWGTTPEGLAEVIRQNRVYATENNLRFIRYLDDFPFKGLSNLWDGLGGAAGSHLRRPNKSGSHKALHVDDNGPRRSGARSDMRLRHDCLCSRAVGAAVDYL